MRRKTVFIAGGSAGLGKEMGKILASQGANVVVFGRNVERLNEVEHEMHARKIDAAQDLRAVPLDLAVADEVDAVLRSEQCLPDDLYCVAGGTFGNMSLFPDMNAGALDMCMKNNYFAAAYPALTVMKAWVEDDEDSEKTAGVAKPRRIIFISSVAALCGLPGYSAYAPAKCAIRGLADTLRLEAMALSGKASHYSVHCAFPSNFVSPGFAAELRSKLKLTQELEGYTGSFEELQRRLPASEEIAELVIRDVERGDFAICDPSMESRAMWANMVGPSPKRGLGIVDSAMSVLMGLFIWPVQRRIWERKCRTS